MTVNYSFTKFSRFVLCRRWCFICFWSVWMCFFFLQGRNYINQEYPEPEPACVCVCLCVTVLLHVELLGHVNFPLLLCRESRRMRESGRRSIVNIDLQFVNSRTHFSKCQACFSTIVSGLFSHRALDEDKVTTLWWEANRRETEESYFLFPFLLCQKKALLRLSGEPFSNVWKQEEDGC